MNIYKWLPLIALAYLMIAFVRFALSVLPKKWKSNPAPPLGKKWPAVIYSFTGAMSPFKKESAFLHLPTYAAGMVFHLGLFIAIINLFLTLVNIELPVAVSYIFMVLFACGFICGISIMIKRVKSPLLREISSPDDYISNLLVSLFQALSALAILNTSFGNILLVYSAFLIVYIPSGKLKHSFYFFTSRIALGVFYGTRGVWGLKERWR